MPNSAATFILPKTAVYGLLANLLMALLFLFAATQHAAAQSEFRDAVTQHGITWHFGETRETGRYANGDWWVMGPVTITEITPRSSNSDGRVINGTMVNPIGSSQGYDSHNSDMPYRSELNVAPSMTGQPLSITTGSVVSSISKASPNANGRPLLDDLAILTVVESRPAADAFRPHPYGQDKTARWRESDLDYGILQSLPKVSNMPDRDRLASRALRFWNEQHTNWLQRTVQASNNQAVYGREIANKTGQMLLILHLDLPMAEKRDIFVGVVQYGLDIYGRLQEGGQWVPNGGHNAGRKMPMLLAGLALGDETIIARANRDEDPNRFQEDAQTFIVSEDHPLYGQEYHASDIGMPEWGVRHWRDPSRDRKSWGAPYRWIGSAMLGHALAAHLTPGAVEAWNWEPFFDYIDRYFEVDTRPTTDRNGIQAFQRSMWEAYRTQGDQNGSRRPSPPQLFVE